MNPRLVAAVLVLSSIARGCFLPGAGGIACHLALESESEAQCGIYTQRWSSELEKEASGLYTPGAGVCMVTVQTSCEAAYSVQLRHIGNNGAAGSYPLCDGDISTSIKQMTKGDQRLSGGAHSLARRRLKRASHRSLSFTAMQAARQASRKSLAGHT